MIADAADLVVHDVDIAVLPVLLEVVHLATVIVGKIRYR